MSDIRRKNGFSLVEIMIVVAIIALLVAIGFPAYKIFVRKAKTAEAVSHLNMIRLLQESYRVENDTYLQLQQNPPGSVPSIPVFWGNPGGNWDKLGFRLTKKVRYQYSAAVGSTGDITTSFMITAQTDFDVTDAQYDTWTLTHDAIRTHTNHYK